MRRKLIESWGKKITSLKGLLKKYCKRMKSVITWGGKKKATLLFDVMY